MVKTLLMTLAFVLSAQAAPPLFEFSVTSNDIDFIKATDPTVEFTVKKGTIERREMPSKLKEGVLFEDKVSGYTLDYEDKALVDVWISPELDPAQQEFYLDKVGLALGKLPFAMRDKLSRVNINAGDATAHAEEKAHFFMLYSLNIDKRLETRDLEETIFHETIHATLEAEHATHPGWVKAQREDNYFVTEYAAERPVKEDLPESALFAYTALKHPGRMPRKIEKAVRKNMPHRLDYFRKLFRE